MKLIFSMGFTLINFFHNKEVGKDNESITLIQGFWDEYLTTDKIWREYLDTPYILNSTEL